MAALQLTAGHSDAPYGHVVAAAAAAAATAPSASNVEQLKRFGYPVKPAVVHNTKDGKSY